MARELNRTDGFTIHGWMVTDLRLRGGELVAYALVHQFTQSGAGKYLGGPTYLAAWMGCSVNSARTYLHGLVGKGLLLTEDEQVNGVLFRFYRINPDPLQNLEYPSKILSTPLQNLEVEDNIDNKSLVNTKLNTNTPISPKKFDFRAALLGLGVSPEVVDAWLQVRKAKKCVNTELAFKTIAREIEKTGRSADDCIRYAAAHSWAGFNAEWLENGTAPRRGSSRPREGAVDRMLALGAKMFGSGETFDFDEQ